MKRNKQIGIALLLSVLSAYGQSGRSHELNPIEKQKKELPALPATQTRSSELRQTGSTDYTKGTFIVNEDWYGHNNGSVNFLSDDGKWIYRAFQKENPGKQLGATSQFGTIYGGKLYIVSKQEKDPSASVTGSKLAVINPITMKVEKEFTTIGGADGRSFLGVDEHTGYIGTSNGIYRYDIDRMEIKEQVGGTGSGGSSLYESQIGTMIRVNNRVFAVQQNKGLLVIDPFTHKVEKVLSMPDGNGLGSIVLSKDGTLWASVAVGGEGSTRPYIWKINPYTLSVIKVEIPTNNGIEEIPNSWYAWTADGFCASATENKIYWKGQGSGSWFTGYAIFCYDIDSGAFSVVYDFRKLDGNWRLYGTGFRIDPATDDMYCFMYHEFLNPEHKLAQIHTDGKWIKEYPYEISNYWFPALPVFPDNEAPVINEEKLPSTITLSSEKNEYSELLNDIITDKDNLVSAVVATITNDKPDQIIAEVMNNRLIIKPIANISDAQTATLSVRFNSNGKTVEKAITVELSDVKPPFYLNKTALTLMSNDQQETLEVSCMDGEEVEWTSSDDKIATVEGGLITGKGEGTATITAASKSRKGVTAVCTVTVKKYVPPVLVSSITFEETPTTIVLGETFQLRAIVGPEDAANKEIKWESKDLSCISIDQNGLITSLKTGTNIQIIAWSTDGSGKFGYFSINSVAPPLVDLKLAEDLYGANSDSIYLDEWDYEVSLIKIPLILTPENAAADSKALKFENWSGIPDGWTFDPNAKGITFHYLDSDDLEIVNSTPFNRTISVDISYGENEDKKTYHASFKLIYSKWINSFSVDIDNLFLGQDSVYDIKPHIQIDRGDFTEEQKSIIYSSSDADIATVTEAGVITTLQKNGTAVITARIADGSYKEQIYLTVGTDKATKVTLSAKEIQLDLHKTKQLAATVDEHASVRSVRWSSNHPEMISVSADGLVLAKTAGKAEVIATSADGAASDTCIVTAGTPLEELVLTPAELTLDINDAVQGVFNLGSIVQIQPNPSNATIIAISGTQGIIKSITSSDQTIISNVSIYEKKMTAYKAGTASLCYLAKEGEISATLSVRITDRSTGVTGITLEQVQLIAALDKTYQIGYRIAGTAETEIEWESSHPDIAAVDDKGQITTKALGQTIIRVTTKTGNFSSFCTVAVVEDFESVERVSLNHTALSLVTGSSSLLIATVTPAEAANKYVSWQSDKPEIATVSQGGIVNALKAGTATITVTTLDGGYTAECQVTVSNPPTPPEPPVVSVNGVSLNLSSLNLKKGETAVLAATVTPSNAANKSVSWAISDATVASLSNGTVTAKAAGTTIVTVTTNEGNHTAACQITVSDPDLDKPVVEVKDSTATLTFPKVIGATLYEVSIYKYMNEVPVLYDTYMTDANGTVISGLKSDLRAASPDKIAISLQHLEGDTEYVVKIIAIKEKDGQKETLGTYYSEPFQTSNTVDNEQISLADASVYYSEGRLYLNNLERYTCYIIGMNGAILQVFEISSPNEQRPISLSEGFYVVMATKENKRISKKILVNK